MCPGTTLDRNTLAKKYGNTYQAFNVDAWAFEPTARAIVGDDASDETIQQVVLAMVYYNLATAITLCGPGMRMIVME